MCGSVTAWVNFNRIVTSAGRQKTGRKSLKNTPLLRMSTHEHLAGVESEAKFSAASPEEQDAEREQTIRELDSIANVHLTELKAIVDPTGPVKLVVEAVMLLMGFKEREAKVWSTARTLVASPSFVARLALLDRDDISPHKAKLLAKYVGMDAFAPANVKLHSTSAHTLCLWFQALHR